MAGLNLGFQDGVDGFGLQGFRVQGSSHDGSRLLLLYILVLVCLY